MTSYKSNNALLDIHSTKQAVYYQPYNYVGCYSRYNQIQGTELNNGGIDLHNREFYSEKRA